MRVIDERRIGKGSEGSGRDLIEAVFWHLLEGTEEDH
jgi:hypothetical protein